MQFIQPFNITIENEQKSEQKSVYVTVDGAYLRVIIELSGQIYGLTPGFWGDYYLLSGFSSDDKKLTYSGDKFDGNQTISLTTNGGGAEQISKDHEKRESLNNWNNLEHIKDTTAIVAVDLAIESVGPDGPGCVIC